MYKFLCGVTDFSLPNATRIFYELMCQFDTLYIAHCAYEFQQPHLFDCLIKKGNGTVTLIQSSHNLKASDSPVIILLLNNPLCWRVKFRDTTISKHVTDSICHQSDNPLKSDSLLVEVSR